MIIVSDSSPLIALYRIEKLELLQQIFQEVIIPPAVFNEISHPEKEGSEHFRKLSWIVVKSPTNKNLIMTIQSDFPKLNIGEIEAIVLAEELKAKLIIDEALGRKTALKLHIQIVGVLGILAASKQAGLVESVVPLINKLQNIGFRLSQNMINATLEKAGEL